MFGITWGTQHGKFYLYTYIRSRSRVSHFRNSLWAEGRKGRDRSPARLRRQNFPSFMWNEREPVSRWTSIVGRSVGPRVNEVWIWATELTSHQPVSHNGTGSPILKLQTPLKVSPSPSRPHLTAWPHAKRIPWEQFMSRGETKQWRNCPQPRSKKGKLT